MPPPMFVFLTGMLIGGGIAQIDKNKVIKNKLKYNHTIFKMLNIRILNFSLTAYKNYYWKPKSNVSKKTHINFHWLFFF